MGDINVNIYEGDAFEGRVTLKEIRTGVYKLDHPLADPDRIFQLIDNNINDMVLYALMHLSNRKGN